MRTEATILIFVLILNLSTLMVMDLGSLGVIPGAVDVKQLNATGSYSLYEERFNATAIVDPTVGWTAPTVDIPIIGDVFGGFMFFVKQILFIIAGFPIWLYYFGEAFIPTGIGLAVWGVISTVLSIIFGIYTSWFLIQFITGRIINE